MSTSFDIGCRDCKQRMGLESGSTVRREEALRFVVYVAHVFQDCDLIDLRIDYVEIDIGFLNKHAEHRLGVLSEYETFESAEERLKSGRTWDEWRRST